MTTTTAKYTVSVRDLGCSIAAVIDHAGKITVTSDGGCGPDCLGASVPTYLSAAGIEAEFRKRFCLAASDNMGTQYDADANGLIVEVR